MESAKRYQECDKPELISIILEQQREVDKLRHIIKSANRQQYGKKSEKLSQEQCVLFSLEASAESNPEPVTVKEHKRIPRGGAKPLPVDLPRERKEYEPQERTCKCCGMELAKIGEDITEELEYVPASFKVIEHARIKRACPRCQNGVVQGSLPDGVQPLERSRPGAGLLTHIVLSKYVDHLPLYRQEQIFLRQGIVVSRQRMCDWVGGVSELLLRLWKALKTEVLARAYVQVTRQRRY